jgi:hypothetical protein
MRSHVTRLEILPACRARVLTLAGQAGRLAGVPPHLASEPNDLAGKRRGFGGTGLEKRGGAGRYFVQHPPTSRLSCPCVSQPTFSSLTSPDPPRLVSERFRVPPGDLRAAVSTGSETRTELGRACFENRPVCNRETLQECHRRQDLLSLESVQHGVKRDRGPLLLRAVVRSNVRRAAARSQPAGKPAPLRWPVRHR